MKTFREFFDDRNHVSYPGVVGEQSHVVWQRLADTLADYADYVREEMVKRNDSEASWRI